MKIYSWGASWGENGFIRLKKTDSSGSPGMCHIAYRPAMIMGGKRTSMWSTLDGGIGGIGGGVAALVGILIFISVLFKRRKYYNYSRKQKKNRLAIHISNTQVFTTKFYLL